MVVGFRPFRELNSLTDVLFRYIQNDDSKNYWNYIQKSSKVELTTDFKDLIFKMLQCDFKKRIGIKEIKLHPWLISTDAADKNQIFEFFNKIVVKNLKNNNLKEKLIKNICKTKINSTKLFLYEYMKKFFANLKNND
jgi:serine/threonine protein kinase